MKTTTKTDVKVTKEDLVNIGHVIAEAFIATDKQSNQTKRELLLEAADRHASNPESVKAILDGYADSWTKAGYADIIVRNRKSEAKKVFEACAITAVSHDNASVLKGFEGTYNEFIAKCRDMIKASAPISEDKPSKAKTSQKLNDNQVSDIDDKLKRATFDQLKTRQDVLTSESLARAENNNLAGLNAFILMASIANQVIKLEGLDSFTENLAETVLDMLNDGINKIQDAGKQAREALKDMAENTPYDVNEPQEQELAEQAN